MSTFRLMFKQNGHQGFVEDLQVSCVLLVQSYYSVYGGAAAQYPVYGAGPGGMMTGAGAAFYPYLQFGEGSGGAAASGGYTSGQGYGVQYPHHLVQYSAINSTGGYPQHYGAPMSLAPTPALQSGLHWHRHLGFYYFCKACFVVILRILCIFSSILKQSFS